MVAILDNLQEFTIICSCWLVYSVFTIILLKDHKFLGWSLTFLNATICSLVGIVASYQWLNNQDFYFANFAHYSFQSYLLWDLIFGINFYLSSFTTPGIAHHVIYLIYEWYILNIDSMNVWNPMCMFFIEEIPFVYLSLCVLDSSLRHDGLYFTLMLSFRGFFHAAALYHFYDVVFVWLMTPLIAFSILFQGYYIVHYYVTYVSEHAPKKSRPVFSFRKFLRTGTWKRDNYVEKEKSLNRTRGLSGQRLTITRPTTVGGNALRKEEKKQQ